MQEDIEIYYDKEGNYLEIIFEKKEGFFTETENEDIMQKVDKEGNVLALSILNAVQKITLYRLHIPFIGRKIIYLLQKLSVIKTRIIIKSKLRF